MIQLERINGKPFFLNENLIEVIEETPDTVITLTNGHKYIVRTPVSSIIDMIKKGS